MFQGTIDRSLSEKAESSPKFTPDIFDIETPLELQLTDETDTHRIRSPEKNASIEPVPLLITEVEAPKKKKKKRRNHHKTKNALSNMFSMGATAPIIKHQGTSRFFL